MLRNLLPKCPQPSSTPQVLRHRARSGMRRSGDRSRSRSTRRRISTIGVPRLASILSLLRCIYTLSTCRTSFQVPRSILSVRTIEFPFFSSNVLSNHVLQLPLALHRNLITHRVFMDGRCCSLQAGPWLSFLLSCIRVLDLLANANA